GNHTLNQKLTLYWISGTHDLFLSLLRALLFIVCIPENKIGNCALLQDLFMKTLKKLLAYPLSVVFYFFFFLTLVVFHPIQWISLNLGGYKAHKRSVDILNFFLLRCLNLLGTKFYFDNPQQLPTDRSCIFVANHQGTYDIPPIIWHLRQQHPKFVSKKELGKGIPSISYNLRHGGSILIDR